MLNIETRRYLLFLLLHVPIEKRLHQRYSKTGMDDINNNSESSCLQYNEFCVSSKRLIKGLTTRAIENQTKFQIAPPGIGGATFRANQVPA
jgi:hypothetical protein